MDELITRQIHKEQLVTTFEKNYNTVSPLWCNHQLEWINTVYSAYRDHDKYMIVVYLIKKTFDFYSKNFVKESYADFFEKEFIQIETLNVMEISKALNIPKESARRKIIELEKTGSIKKIGKKIIIDKKTFLFIKPEKSITRVSRFFSALSHIMFNEKIMQSEFTTIQIVACIEKNFSHIWKLYYELQIPLILEWKKNFKDIESYHIWGVCVVNEQFNMKKNAISKMSKKEYLKFFYNYYPDLGGLNAMSISDISGIPRATVIRKLNILIKKKYLIINDKKHYSLAKDHNKKLFETQKINFGNLADFTSKIFNLMLVEQLHFKNNLKQPFHLNLNQ